jgi:putative MATE family efflux protein
MVKPENIVGEIPSDQEIYKTAMAIAWPSALESVLVQLISSADLIMVGVLGAAAISAVGITNQPRLILLAVIFSLNIGVTAVVARRKGEDDREAANNTLRQSLMISGILSLALTVAGIAFAKPIIVFAGAQDEIVENAVIYFKIICIGNFFTSLGLTINAAQRGVGNTKISLRTNVVANIVNLALDYVIITGRFGFPALGVPGDAISTAIGNFVGFLLSLKSITITDGFLQLKRKQSWKPEKHTIMTIFNISGSAFVEQVFMRIGFFTTNKLIAGLGTVAFATHQICMNLMSISFSFGDGLGIAASALVGQNLGAKRPDMATIYGKTLQRMALTVGVVFIMAFIFGRSFFVALYTNDQAVITAASGIMLTIAAMAPIQASNVVVSGILRGAGDTKFVANTSFFSIGLVRPGATWLFCYPFGLGLIGAWFAFATDQALRLIINYSRFLTGKWAKITI